MKKLVLMAWALALPLLALAQQPTGWNTRSAGTNWELGVAGGFHNVWNPMRDYTIKIDPHITSAMEVSLSKWFTPQLGARLAWEGWQVEHSYTEPFSFAYIHADLLWNASSRIWGYDPSRVWDVIPYGHFGYLHEWRGEQVIEREYGAGVGLIGRVRLGRRVHGTLDLRSILQNGAGSQGIGIGLLNSAQLGLSVTLGQVGWKPASAGDVLPGELGDNWFVSAGFGVNSLTQLSFEQPRLTGSAAPAFELAVGKWVSPAIGVRVALQGIAYAGHGNDPREYVTASATSGEWAYREQFNFVYPHIDLLWNVRNTFRGYQQRGLMMAPYAHFGAIQEFGNGHDGDREYAAGAGLLVQGPVSGALGWHLDFRGTAFTAAATGDRQAPHSVGLTALAGLQYSLGRPDWNFSGAAAPRRIQSDALPLFKAGQGWFVQTSVGVRSLFDIGQYFQIHSVDKPVACGELAFGKWFSPVSGFRVGVSGLSQVFEDQLAGYADFHADYLFNLFQWISPNERRVWNPIPYLSGGYLAGYQFGDPARGAGPSGWVWGGGLLNTIRLFPQLDLTLDVRGTLIPPYADIAPGHGYMAAAEALLGLQYRPDEKPWYPSEQTAPRKERHLWALSTNLADYVDYGNANLELLYGVARHWTLDALVKYGLFNGGNYDQRERYAVGARWWPWYTYSGLWVRGLVQTENYARSGVPVFQDGKGQAWGMSLSAGYSLMLLKWLNLDLGAGVWGGRRGLPGGQQDWFAEPEMITVGLMFVF